MLILLIYGTDAISMPKLATRRNFLSSVQWRFQKEEKRCASGVSENL
jgi:hypothetical protein